jgi:hypothetical protein
MVIDGDVLFRPGADWAGPESVLGLFRSREELRPFRLQPLAANQIQSEAFVTHAQRSASREVSLEDVTDSPEGEWFIRFATEVQILSGNIPAPVINRGNRGQPVAVIVPMKVNTVPLLFVFRVTDSMAAKFGREWMTLSSDGDRIRELRIASEQEREWQIDQSLICVASFGLVPRVLTEAPREGDATPLAALFDQLDPVGRASAGAAAAASAVAALAGIDNATVRFSDATAESLATKAAANLQFAGRLTRAMQAKRWEKLTSARMWEALGDDAGARWGIEPAQVRMDGGRLILDVSDTTALRILRDAFGTSLLNEEDLIEGERRPSEHPDTINPAAD